MNTIDPNGNSLYFTAAASASRMAAEEAKKKDKESAVSGSKFRGLVKDKQQENLLISQGLPPEIAGMSDEDAFVYLKDAIDLAGNDLSLNSTSESLEKYKKAISQFIKYIEKTNYTVEEHKRFGKNKKGRARDPAIQIVAINQKLEQLSYDIWYNHLDKLKLLERIHEINGLVVDLMAS